MLLGRGDGTFQPAVGYGTTATRRSVTIGDFNGDGKLDVVAANRGGVAVLLDTGCLP
ncbi:MAG TPA: VCBS repeat-containing protein [Myxococcales bacterium]|nr:VCBS repeat-containing protein [Myxococcales bacterium]